MEDADKIKKTIGRPEVKEIIEFIKENPGATTQNVVDHLKHEKIPASRLTTLSMIDKLVLLDIIKDDRIGSYSHRLRYNDSYNWEELALDLLTSYLEQIKNLLSRLTEDEKTMKINDGKRLKLSFKLEELEKALKRGGLAHKIPIGKKQTKR